VSGGLPPPEGAPPLVLASGSATRLAMLRAAGLAPEARPAAVDEEEIKAAMRAAGATAEAVALALAETKAARISGRMPGALVIGADQMLDCEGRWFDKPACRDAARTQLLALAGRTHRLVSAVVAARNGVRVWHHVEAAHLAMRSFDAAFVDAYLDAAGERVTQSVGAYQVEGLGIHLFARITGDWFTVLGLPLLPLLDYLRGAGAVRS